VKTLILNDQTWQKMLDALVDTQLGLEVLSQLDAEPEIPSDRELVAAARSDETPAIFVRRAAERDAARQAGADTRAALDDLIRHAHAAGVGPAVLSRWSGLRPRRVYEVLGS
jgi:hypothetical protein